jgi:hypothetical protein
MSNLETETNNNNLIILVSFCRSLARAGLHSDDYLSSELWLRIARKLESEIVE